MVLESPWPPPHLLHLPPGVESYAAGEEAADFAESSLGIVLDPWQRWVLLNCLAETIVDGQFRYASFENAIITPRQNGKNFILEVLELASLFLFGDKTIVHSAHKFDTSVEHFNRIKELMQNSDELSKLLLPNDRSFVVSNGKEHIRLKTGQRLLFKARYRGSSRGFTGDKVVMDEAFDLDPSAMGSVIPTLSTRSCAQVFYTSSAAHESSQVLHAVRARAVKDDVKDRLAYFEYGNGPEVLDLDPVVDEAEFVEAIKRANPAIEAGRISMEYIMQEVRTFSGSEELVREHQRERLGVVSMPPEERESVVPMGTWHPLAADTAAGVPQIESGLCIAFDVTEDRKWVSFGVAGRTGDGRAQVEIAAAQLATDVDESGAPGWVVPLAVKLFEEHKVPLRVEKNSPAGAYISRLEAAGIEVEPLSTADHARAVGLFLDSVASGELQHLADGRLTGQVQLAEVRNTGDSVVWSRRRVKNVSGLVACTLALSGVPEWRPVTKKKIGMVFG